MKTKNYFLAILLLSFLTSSLNAQLEYAKWEFGGGLRFNYLGLSGG
jgi:hypothetical protein